MVYSVPIPILWEAKLPPTTPDCMRVYAVTSYYESRFLGS